jgi:LysM repeat protein
MLPSASEAILFAPTPKSRQKLPPFKGVTVTGKAGHKQLTYVVQSGDTLSKIARNVGSRVSTLSKHNHIDDPNLIQVGQKIDLPLGKHRVKSGETYWGIAQAIGIDVHTLMALNGAKPDGLLRVGQELLVPAGQKTRVDETQPQHEEVPASLAALAKTPAFQKLSAAGKHQLVALAGQKSLFGQQLLPTLDQLVASPAFQKANPAKQSELLTQALENGTPFLVMAEGKSPEPVPYKLGKPTLEKKHHFPGKTTAADVYPVTIGGQTIKIYEPHDHKFNPPEQLPAEQIARILAELPAQSRAQIKSVSADPVQNPDDAYWAKQYNMPDFVSYMTCGADGAADIYPQNYEGPDAEIAESLIHETGHAWSMREWGDAGTEAKWTAWEKACREDGPLTPSQYAKSSSFEDVAETTALYLMTRGTPVFKEYQAAFPHRFKLLDQQFGTKAAA